MVGLREEDLQEEDFREEDFRAEDLREEDLREEDLRDEDLRLGLDVDLAAIRLCMKISRATAFRAASFIAAEGFNAGAVGFLEVAGFCVTV